MCVWCTKLFLWLAQNKAPLAQSALPQPLVWGSSPSRELTMMTGSGNASRPQGWDSGGIACSGSVRANVFIWAVIRRKKDRMPDPKTSGTSSKQLLFQVHHNSCRLHACSQTAQTAVTRERPELMNNREAISSECNGEGKPLRRSRTDHSWMWAETGPKLKRQHNSLPTVCTVIYCDWRYSFTLKSMTHRAIGEHLWP